MKRELIKELAQSVAKHNEMSDKDLNWLFSRLSKKELKTFVNLLSWEIKNRKVDVSYAGSMTDDYKKRVMSLFPDKRAEFKEDSSLAAGLRFEYGDYILDYSVSGIIKRVLENIKGRL